MDALYDLGMYMNFFINGHKQLRSILNLDPNKSFSHIQCALFMKYSAAQEL